MTPAFSALPASLPSSFPFPFYGPVVSGGGGGGGREGGREKKGGSGQWPSGEWSGEKEKSSLFSLPSACPPALSPPAVARKRKENRRSPLVSFPGQSSLLSPSIFSPSSLSRYVGKPVFRNDEHFLFVRRKVYMGNKCAPALLTSPPSGFSGALRSKKGAANITPFPLRFRHFFFFFRRHLLCALPSFVRGQWGKRVSMQKRFFSVCEKGS